MALAVLATLLLVASPRLSLAEEPGSPLARYPGFGSDPHAEEDQFDREEMQRQQLIAACMRAAGFTYTPRLPTITVTEETFAGLSEAEAEAKLAELLHDPNEAYIASLSAAERAEYYLRLIGKEDPTVADSPAVLDANGDGVVSHAEGFGGGCQGDAYRALPGIFFLPGLLKDEIRALRAAIQVDPRAHEAKTNWVECMNEAGFAGSSRDEVYERRDQALAAGEVEALASSFDSADAACSIEYNGQMEAVTRAHETEFVERHRPTLERYAQPPRD